LASTFFCFVQKNKLYALTRQKPVQTRSLHG
jgi:hypothetical protein